MWHNNFWYKFVIQSDTNYKQFFGYTKREHKLQKKIERKKGCGIEEECRILSSLLSNVHIMSDTCRHFII